MYFVYFLTSLKNNKVYVGSTNKDPKIRLIEHNQGSNQWTKQNGPFRLIYYEKYDCKKDAQLREAFYKTGFGKMVKKAIIQSLINSGIGAIG